MAQVKRKALRQLSGNYGTVAPGQIFETDEETARELDKAGFTEAVGETGGEKTLEEKGQAEERKSIGPLSNKAMPDHSNK